MKNTCLVLLALILVFASACSAQPTPVKTTAPTQTNLAATGTVIRSTPQPTGQNPAPIVVKLTLEQKVGQAFMVSFTGTTLTPEVREMIEKYHIGGVVLGAENISNPLQTAKLVAELQDAAVKSGHSGLIVAIEQEGGSASPLSESKGFTTTLGALATAATEDAAVALQNGELLGNELKLLGINTAFAPVLDLSNNSNDPASALRSYGSNSEKAGSYATGYLTGLQKSGVMAVGKTFPGAPLSGSKTP
jgi:beta-N-acetylhexosaminidase